MQLSLNGAGLLPAQTGIQIGGSYPQGLQGLHLILHQGDQGRDDHSNPRTQQGRNLITQRFSAPRRHQYERTSSLGDVLDDFLLLPLKGGKPKTSCKTSMAVD